MKPILFSSEMVKAILDGRKTQTRIPLKPQPLKEVQCPWKVGDKLWVVDYKATSDAYVRWKPSTHVDQWTSRIALEITDIRVEKNKNDVWEWVLDFKIIKQEEAN